MYRSLHHTQHTTITINGAAYTVIMPADQSNEGTFREDLERGLGSTASSQDSRTTVRKAKTTAGFVARATVNGSKAFAKSLKESVNGTTEATDASEESRRTLEIDRGLPSE